MENLLYALPEARHCASSRAIISVITGNRTLSSLLRFPQLCLELSLFSRVLHTFGSRLSKLSMSLLSVAQQVTRRST